MMTPWYRSRVLQEDRHPGPPERDSAQYLGHCRSREYPFDSCLWIARAPIACSTIHNSHSLFGYGVEVQTYHPSSTATLKQHSSCSISRTWYAARCHPVDRATVCDRLTHYTRTTQSSFESTKLWIEQLQQFAAANVVIALVGNKSVRTCLMIRDARTQVCATPSLTYVTYILAQPGPGSGARGATGACESVCRATRNDLHGVLGSDGRQCQRGLPRDQYAMCATLSLLWTIDIGIGADLMCVKSRAFQRNGEPSIEPKSPCAARVLSTAIRRRIDRIADISRRRSRLDR